MTDSKKILAAQGGALLVALGTGVAIGNVTAGGEPAAPQTSAPVERHVDKRLDVATDVEVQPGVSITASGTVTIGTRLVPITQCVGHYDATTSICVLSPGPWELHSACYERSGVDPATTCEVIVRNTGKLPLKFVGYVEVAAPRAEGGSEK